MQQVGTLVYSVEATTAIAAKRGVSFAGAQAGAGVACMGVSDTAIAQGDTGRVVVGVTGIWETGAAIDGAENRLATDAQGRVVPWAAGPVCARLKPGETAAAAGEFIEVFIIQSEA